MHMAGVTYRDGRGHVLVLCVTVTHALGSPRTGGTRDPADPTDRLRGRMFAKTIQKYFKAVDRCTNSFIIDVE